MNDTATSTVSADAFPEGHAIIYCEGALGTTHGKTAHGLIRRTRRYRVLSVVDSRHAGRDAGRVLGGEACGIPVVTDVPEAVVNAKRRHRESTHLVVGLAPDGGRLGPRHRAEIQRAIDLGLHIDCGLHDFLSEDPVLAAAAAVAGVRLRDVRRPLPSSQLHFFSGKIGEVDAFKIAILGTDSAVGKRTTAWLLADALERAGLRTEMIGTGQTAWMQGVRYGVVMDSLINDFVSGEIEHALWSAWTEQRPDVIVIEGQGSLMNPAYPGGYEILAAGRPDVVVLQHAPARREYDGFPGYPLHSLKRQIGAIELVSDRPVVALTLNLEGVGSDRASAVVEEIGRQTGLPTCDPLHASIDELARVLMLYLNRQRERSA